MKIFNKIVLIFVMLIFILSLKCFAYEGEVVTFDGITTKMPEIVTEITEDDPMQIRELNKNNTELNQGSVMMARVGSSTEGINNIISKYANEKTAVGIDVSYYQGSIDWKQVADSGVTFAMIRCGYRGYGSEGNLVEDVRFREYIQGALDNGIYVGIYFFSAAINEAEALQEAKMTVDLIKNYNITYPVAYDFEYYGNWTSPSGNPYRTNGLSNDQMNRNAKVFLNYIKSQGYKSTMYASTSYLNDTWDMANISNEHDTWVAHYGVSKPTYRGEYQMWQYGDNGIVPGISTKVDIDIDYHYYATMKTSISGRGYIKSGPLDWKYDGATIGTVGSGIKLEKLRICLNNKVLSGTVQYRSQIQDIGWENEWHTDNQITGKDGKRLETIQVRLTDEMAIHYDLYYRVHVQDYGWLGWAKNGESAGTEGKSKRVEAIELKLIPKHANPPGSTANRFIRSSGIKYKSYVRGLGWQKTAWEGSSSGTTGLGKKIESLNVELVTKQYNGGVEYRAHVQDTGWTPYVKDGANAGSPDSNKRLEAIEVRLYGDVTNYYDIYYRVHCQNVGWLDWGKNGEAVGTMGQGLRIEAIEIKLVDKGAPAPRKNNKTTCTRKFNKI